MKQRLFVFALSLLTASAAFADGKTARAKFVESFGSSFQGDAIAAEALEPKHDFERAKGEGAWQIALPVNDDERVQFLDVVVRNGKFVKGMLHTFGYRDRKITAMQFKKFRADSIMLARRSGPIRTVKGNGVELPQPVAVYAPTCRSMRYAPPPHRSFIDLDPCGRLLGYSRKIFGDLRINLGTLKYDVVLEGPDGVKVVLGGCTVGKGVSQETVVQAIRNAIEKKYPGRTGAVSDRDVVDFYGASTVVCSGVGRGE